MYGTHNILTYFFSELLKIMDEAEHLAEARALMKPGASKEAGVMVTAGKKRATNSRIRNHRQRRA